MNNSNSAVEQGPFAGLSGLDRAQAWAWGEQSCLNFAATTEYTQDWLDRAAYARAIGRK